MATRSYIASVFLYLFLGSCWCKNCNNYLSQPTSHTLRAELAFSTNETWKREMKAYYDHPIPSEDYAWNSLLPARRSNLEHQPEEEEKKDSTSSSKKISVKEEFDWTTLYRRMRHNMEVNVSKGESFLQEVPLQNVRLDPKSIHGIAQHTNFEYLLLLDVDRLVYNFRVTAGLPSPGQAHGGWEKPKSELRGHFVGHYMSSSAMMWAATQNETLKETMTAVVSALGECQRAMGTGYLSAFPSELFDRLEALIPVWAPYYTIHKIMAGLLDQHKFAGNTEAYNMTVWMAEYFYNRVHNVIKRYTIERHWEALNDEFGGMNDVLYRLYTLSGNPKHLELAHLFDKPCFLGLLAMQVDNLAYFHANTHIPEVVGAQMRYEVLGDSLYKDMASFFMDIINSSHSYATGGTSKSEHWVESKRLATYLGKENEESCTTYNMLKIARNLFRWTKEMAYADYYERALTNGVLPIQRGTKPGVMIYMLPLGAGVSKATTFHGWGTKYRSFWCCYGTGIESFSKLGDSIYFQEQDNPSLYIIQFISSTLTSDSIGFTLKQEVQQLSSLDPNLQVSLEFSSLENSAIKNEEATINIRIPFWTTQNASAMLNGEILVLPYPGNFLTVKRKWVSGDKVSLSFPVSLRTEQIQDDRPKYRSIKAIMFGPYLLSGMSDGNWDIQIGEDSSISDWITPVPLSHGSQLFTFSQEGKISGVSANNTLVLKFNNSHVSMDHFPKWGTNEAAHSTFRIVDTASPDIESKSVVDFVGKKVYLEPFVDPGAWIVHQGINNNVIVAHKDNAIVPSKYHCTLRSCAPKSIENGGAIFNVRLGLNGNINSISFESTNLPSCFLYGATTSQVGQAITLRCMPKIKHHGFNHAVSFNADMGLTKYHPISFVARGLYTSYLLEPILAYKDESYTAYFNITV